MDDNDREDKPDETPAPPLSAEFMSGGTAAGLEKIRARLLDLTNRNRLLNFRHSSASSIRIVDAVWNAEHIVTRGPSGLRPRRLVMVQVFHSALR